MRLVDAAQIMSGIVPADLQSAQDGDWCNMANYGRCTVVFFKAAGTSGDDPIVRLQQATDNSGTSAKDLRYTEYWIKQGTLTSVGQFTRIVQDASANTGLNTTSAESQVIMVIEVDASQLDVAGGFNHVRFRVDDVGTNAQLGCCLYILTNPRYSAQSLPSAL